MGNAEPLSEPPTFSHTDTQKVVMNGHTEKMWLFKSARYDSKWHAVI